MRVRRPPAAAAAATAAAGPAVLLLGWPRWSRSIAKLIICDGIFDYVMRL